MFSRLFGKKKSGCSAGARRREAEKLHGSPIRYVTEMRQGNEDVVGRGGSLAVHGDEFLVDASGDTVFRCKVEQLQIAYLMSGDGVVLCGPDMTRGGEVRTVTAHFVYYRK